MHRKRLNRVTMSLCATRICLLLRLTKRPFSSVSKPSLVIPSDDRPIKPRSFCKSSLILRHASGLVQSLKASRCSTGGSVDPKANTVRVYIVSFMTAPDLPIINGGLAKEMCLTPPNPAERLSAA